MRAIHILGLSVILGAGGGTAYALLFNEDARPKVTVPLNASGPGVIATADSPDVEQGLGNTLPATLSDDPAEGPLLCKGQKALPPPAQDGRLMNHYPYADAASTDLAPPPKGFGGPGCPSIHRDMVAPLKAMIAAAAKDDAGVGKAIMGVSCYRSIPRQAELFCRADRIAERGYEGQAKWVAPPGYSEHATGLTIDFGARTIPKCHAETCFKDTRTGQWLAKNARKYGFEMSFPAGNKQGVSPEPWHFRFVGTDGAKAVFNAARSVK